MTNDVFSKALDDLFISLFSFNDLRTFILILAAIFLGKLISNPLSNVTINLAQTLRKELKIEPEDNISDRSIVSFFYCITALFAGILVNTLHPEYSTQEKLVSAIAWPFLAYVLLSGIMLVITPFFMLPYDLLKFFIFFHRRFLKK